MSGKGFTLVVIMLLNAAPCVSPGAEATDDVHRKARLKELNLPALRLAIADLTDTFGPKYPKGNEYAARLDALEKALPRRADGPSRGMAGAVDPLEGLRTLRQEALLANPLLDFDRLLLIKRRPLRGDKPGNPDTSFGWDMGLPRSSFGNTSLKRGISDDEIAVLSPVSPDGAFTTVYKAKGRRFITDVDLHFDATKLLFSMRDDNGRWQIFEIGSDGRGLRQVSRGDQPDVESYDGCYLPDGGIVFASTACLQAVPCNGSHVSVLYRMDADGGNMRQLCFDQDLSYNPTMLPSGRVLYLRWEYADLAHAFSRILFSMNPDGTGQMEYYGSNSVWPNCIFGARPIPQHPGKFVGIVAGHHGSYREGELTLFDVAKGRHETDGVIQQIPGHGKRVEPVYEDWLTENSWPKFAHPYPLSDKYFLVTCKRSATSPWDICLVDVFDNMLTLCHLDGYALFEPIPLRSRVREPVIPNRIDPRRNDAIVHLADVYHGPGLAGVPRGTVKRLRLVGYHYAYQGNYGALLGAVGLDGPWDVKRVLGTVPVEPDGSALFRIPANTPITLQPLDAEGKALQLMRSWLVGMPGETVSCAGCHEPQSTTPPSLDVLAADRPVSEIEPWYGPPRNFSFKREVQPVIDKYCVGCHRPDSPVSNSAGGIADLRGTRLTSDYASANHHSDYAFKYRAAKTFSVGYFELSRYVRRPGLENDLHLLAPLEFHADTTELVQMLRRGHYNVKLDAEAWDRLITWIDLNTPYHGTWTEIGRTIGRQRGRRRQLQKRYAGVDVDPEALADVEPPKVEPVMPEPLVERKPPAVACPGWPFDAAEAARRQAAGGSITKRTVELADGVEMGFVLIPAGEFVMGDTNGAVDERPLTRVRINRPFWMATCEVTNRQFAQFDPQHDSGVESTNGYQYGPRGYPVNRPNQPVVRVTWKQAIAFCEWLSRRSGERFNLPTEAQWEYACRAGSDGPMFFGAVDADFSPFANMADVKLKDAAMQIGGQGRHFIPIKNPTKYDDWIPRSNRYNDRGLVSVKVASYQASAWGLHDMHGNVAEWTLSSYRPYPYHAADGRDAGSSEGRKVVRGGSWRDRPKRCRTAFRQSYPAWQRVYNVGFRVVCVANRKDQAPKSFRQR